MGRMMCYRCFWPQPLCWCGSITPMHTRTQVVILMHPKEYKQEKAGTGRLTHLCLADSLLHMGVNFDEHAEVQALINDPLNYPVLLYPGEEAFNLSHDQLKPEALGGRRLTVFILDATWSCARKMLRISKTLKALPRIMFLPKAPSRFVIKQQPQEGCLSTLEATHELLMALEQSGLDHYSEPDQLLGIFKRMQDYQIACASDPTRPGYRRQAYSDPASRPASRATGSSRRSNFLRTPFSADTPGLGPKVVDGVENEGGPDQHEG
jgi:DTW domain-containing protein YfiP